MKPRLNEFDPLARAGLAGMLLAMLFAMSGTISAQPVSYYEALQAKARGLPNIIFIMADDLGYGDVGCYGQEKIKTPNIDKLAAEGMRFTSAYAGSTVCAPSRAVLMTGRHTGHVRIRGNKKIPLADEDVTVAELLQPAGYRSGVIGKWGLGQDGTSGVPQNQGFEEWFGYLDQTLAHNYYPEYLWRHDPHGQARGKYLLLNKDGKKIEYSHDLFTKASLNFLRLNKDRPFFLYLAYTIPHANNEKTREDGNGMEVPGDEPYSDEDWPQPEKNKAAMITRMDTDIGKIMEKLKELKIDQDTIVFFTSDNGPHKEGGNDPEFFNSSGPLRGIKRDLYEGGIRVPMIVRWPDHVEAGSVSDLPWAFWDFLPTAAELAQVKPPSDIDGISIVPTLLGKPQTEQHEFLYWEFHEGGFKQAIRMDDWKAVRLAPGKPLELYNLKDDIGETKNVAEAHPEVVAKIEAHMKSARTESKDWPVDMPSSEKSEKQASGAIIQNGPIKNERLSRFDLDPASALLAYDFDAPIFDYFGDNGVVEFEQAIREQPGNSGFRVEISYESR